LQKAKPLGLVLRAGIDREELSKNQAHKVVGVLFELQVQQLGTSVKFHASAGRSAGWM
jgi:hypothetical protein